MGEHDRYGKNLLRKATGGRFFDCAPFTLVHYAGERGNLDGFVEPDIAVEIDSRTGKQVRGAVLDLIHHDAPKKLLVIMPVHNRPATAPQCESILARHVAPERFRVVLLQGNGHAPDKERDIQTIRHAIAELDRV